MDEELFELAKDNDLTLDEAQEVQDLAGEAGSISSYAMTPLHPLWLSVLFD